MIFYFAPIHFLQIKASAPHIAYCSDPTAWTSSPGSKNIHHAALLRHQTKRKYNTEINNNPGKPKIAINNTVTGLIGR